MRAFRPVFAGAVLAAPALGLLFAGSAAAAASCAHVTITPGVQSPTLSPKTATIVAGGCAAYTNSTALPVKVTVGKLSIVVNPNGVATYLERVAGTFPVSAQEQFQGQAIGGTGSGTLVVKPKPAPKPSPSPSKSPAPHPSGSASSAPPSATPSSSGPVVASTAPTQPPPSTPGLSPAPNQSGQGNPPVIVGMPPPTPTPSSPPPAVTRAQLQPPSGRAAGLPAAIAALLVVGGAAGFVRVLLAEPGPFARTTVPRPS